MSSLTVINRFFASYAAASTGVTDGEPVRCWHPLHLICSGSSIPVVP